MSSETEKLILATVWAYPETFQRLEEVGLRTRDFTDSNHGALWNAMTRSGVIDPTTGALDTTRLYEALEGLAKPFWVSPVYILGYLSTADFNREAAVWGARKLIEASARERVYKAAVAAVREVEYGGSIVEILAALESVIADERGDSGRPAVSLDDMIADVFGAMMSEHESPIPCRVGLPIIDEHFAGFFGGELFVIGARPGIGKTSVLTQMLIESAKAGSPALFFSGEMGIREIGQKILSQESGVNGNRIRLSDRLTSQDSDRLFAAQRSLKGLPVYTSEIRGRKIEELCATAKRLVRAHGIKIIGFDYLQLINGSTQAARLNRYQEISEVSRQLKLLAQETKTIVIALAQINREGDKAFDKKPQISHLKESGQIEQDADMIILLSRPDQAKPETLLNIAKNRHGANGEFTLEFSRESTRFVGAYEGAPHNALASATARSFEEQLGGLF
jgi:replicative DNA helicase